MKIAVKKESEGRKETGQKNFCRSKKMNIRRPLALFLFALAVMFAFVYVLVQSFDDTRNGTAARVTKVLFDF